MKTLRLFLCCIGMLLFAGNVHSQDLKVTSFQRMDRDLLARTQERLDLNDVPCAIVRVSVANAKDYTFEGNVIGEVIYRPGEALVYMTQGSKNLTITSDKFGSLKYEFGEKLEKQVVYKLALKFNEAGANKTRTLVMPVVGVGSTTSFGIMVGIVKKAGGYVKAKYNFKNQSTDGECTSEGMNASNNELWFSGNTASSRLAITGGALFRLSMPFYLYAGAGFGYKKLAWETMDGQWMENTDETHKGVEVETGLIFRAKNIAFSAGVQSNSFKYMEATVGIGIMF